MKQGITIQERLKDLRTERHLKLEELAAVTGISKSALRSYENDELKEISHKNLVELAKFYGVSADYIPCRTENRNPPNLELTELLKVGASTTGCCVRLPHMRILLP